MLRDEERHYLALWVRQGRLGKGWSPAELGRRVARLAPGLGGTSESAMKALEALRPHDKAPDEARIRLLATVLGADPPDAPPVKREVSADELMGAVEALLRRIDLMLTVQQGLADGTRLAAEEMARARQSGEWRGTSPGSPDSEAPPG